MVEQSIRAVPRRPAPAAAGTSGGVRSQRDLETRADLVALITEFYLRAFADDLIGPVFTEVARLDLAAHLPTMCDFWEMALFRRGAYRRNAFAVHRSLHVRHPLRPQHFGRWLDIWTETVDESFGGPVAERAKTQASRIAASMSRRLSAVQVENPPPSSSEAKAGKSGRFRG